MLKGLNYAHTKRKVDTRAAARMVAGWILSTIAWAVPRLSNR
jgi:hypothetical protein